MAGVMAGHNQAGSRAWFHVTVGKDLPWPYPRFGHALRTWFFVLVHFNQGHSHLNVKCYQTLTVHRVKGSLKVEL